MPKLFSTIIICIGLALPFQYALAQNCTVSISTVPANTTTICNGASVTLIASAGAASGFTWAPPAGLSGTTGAAVTATPSSTTTYTVTAVGCNGSATIVINVDHPVANFTSSAGGNPCSSTPINFTNTSTPATGLTYSWNFNDGSSGAANTSAAANPSHQFDAYGSGTSTYNVSLNVTDANGCSATVTHPVTVTNSPNAAIADTNKTTPFAICGGPETFNLVINNASTTQGTNASYTIDWGDNTAVFSGATIPMNLTHTYDFYGYMYIILTVTGTNGCVSTDTIPVFNGNGPVNLAPVITPPTDCQCAPYSITVPISNIGNNTLGTSYTVTFGDGSPPEFYVNPPPYTVTHTFTMSSCGFSSGSFNNTFYIDILSENSCGASESVVAPFRVCTAPTTMFTISPTVNQCLNTNSYTFTNTSIGQSINGSSVSTTCSTPNVTSWTFNPNTVTITGGTITSNQVTTHFLNPGNYNVTLITQTNCGNDTLTQQICIANQPTSAFVASPATHCIPDTIAIVNNSTAGGCNTESYNWTVSPGFGWTFISGTTNTSFVPVFSFTTAGTYTLTLTQNSACGTITSQQNITVVGLPTVSVNPLANGCLPLTKNPSATVNASNGTISSYLWTFNGGNPGTSPQLNPGSVSFSTAGTDEIILAATNQCGTGEDSTALSVSNSPVITINNDTAICNGSSVTLTANSAGATFFWNPFNGLNTFFSSTVEATPSSSITYTVTATNANGCTAKDSVSITVNPAPSLNINGTPNSICPGDSFTIVASGGTAAYTWNPSTGLGSTTGATVKASPGATTVYHVQSASAAGCPGQATFTAMVNPLPVLNVTPIPAVICGGTGDTLRVTGTVSYNWSAAPGLTVINDSTVFAAPTDTSIFTVTGTNSFTCKDSAHVQVNVVAPPALVVTHDTAVCSGTSAALHASGATNYAWKPTQTLNDSTGTIVTATPLSVTTYFITGTSGNCSALDSVVVSVLPLPTVNFPASTSMCAGAPATITVSGASTYSWSPPATLNTAAGASVIANPSANITYTLIATGANGCFDTVYPQVVVNPLPTVSFSSNPVNLCLNSSDAVGINGAATYQWKPAGGFAQTKPDSVQISVQSTTTYTVTGTTQFGCEDSTMLPVNVNQNVIIPQNDTAVCSGQKVTLNVSNALFYTWSPPAGLTSLGISTVLASPTITTTYTVVGTTAFLCTTSASVVITINPLPVFTVSPPADNLCFNDTVTFTASGAANYTWTPSTGLSAAVGAIVEAFPADTTIYTVISTGAGGCSTSVTVPVNVISPPSVSAGPNETLCLLDPSVYLFGFNPFGGTWSGTGITNGFTGQFSPQAAGAGTFTITYKITDTYGCKNSDSMKITVAAPVAAVAGNDTNTCANSTAFSLQGYHPAGGTWSGAGVSPEGIFDPSTVGTGKFKLFYAVPGQCYTQDSIYVTVNAIPAVSIIASDSGVCPGENVNLTAKGGISYAWLPSQTLNSNAGVNVVATPTVTTTYTVTATDGNNCSNTASLPIVVFPPPNIGISPADPVVCIGNSVTLTAVGATNYTWSPATGINQTTGSAVIASPTVTQTYTVTGTESHQCTGSAQVVVSINPLPSIAASTSSPWICPGDSVTLNAFGASAYTWSPSLSLSSSVGNQVTALPNATTTYTVTGTDANNCSDTSSVSVSVSIPQVIFPAVPAICQRDSVVLTASGSQTYVWVPASNIILNKNDTVIAKPNVTTTFTVTGTDAHGCTAINELTVTVNFPQISFDKDSVVLCKGASQTIIATGANAYVWFPATGLNSTTTAGVTANPAQNITYTVVGMDTQGCTDSASIGVSVYPVPVPHFTFVTQPCENLFVSFVNQSTGATSYTWSFGDGGTSNAQNAYYTYLNPKIYDVTLEAIGGGGCSSAFDTSINIPAYDVYVPSAFSPNHDGINDYFKPIIVEGITLTYFHFEVFTRWGERVYSSSTSTDDGWDGSINGKAAGIDVYAWAMEYISSDCTDKKIIKGHVALVK